MKKWIISASLLLLHLQGWGQVDPFLAGRACMIQEKYDSALVYLKQANELDQEKRSILMNLGICHYKMRNFPAARESFYEAEKRWEGLGSFYLAKTEVRLNHPQQALKYLRIHLSSRYKLTEREILLDPDLSELDGGPGWKQLWNEQAWYSEDDASFQEAQFLVENGEKLEAINILNELEKNKYKKSLVQEEKAKIYTSLGNLKAAQSSLKSAVKSDTRNVDALLALSALQLEKGEFEEAILSLNGVIRREADRFEAYLLRATARSSSGLLSSAIEDLDLYLLYFPHEHEVRYQKGLFLYEHGKYLDAIPAFNRALEMDSGKAEYYFARGLTYAATGTDRYADKDMSMALDLDPYNGEIWLEKGKLDAKMGEKSAACNCFKKAHQYGIFEAAELMEKTCN